MRLDVRLIVSERIFANGAKVRRGYSRVIAFEAKVEIFGHGHEYVALVPSTFCLIMTSNSIVRDDYETDVR